MLLVTALVFPAVCFPQRPANWKWHWGGYSYSPDVNPNSRIIYLERDDPYYYFQPNLAWQDYLWQKHYNQWRWDLKWDCYLDQQSNLRVNRDSLALTALGKAMAGDEVGLTVLGAIAAGDKHYKKAYEELTQNWEKGKAIRAEYNAGWEAADYWKAEAQRWQNLTYEGLEAVKYWKNEAAEMVRLLPEFADQFHWLDGLSIEEATEIVKKIDVEDERHIFANYLEHRLKKIAEAKSKEEKKTSSRSR
jgi:hypothetical protein